MGNKSKNSDLNLTEVEEEKIIGTISKGVEVSTEWWIRANKTDWQTIYIDINSSNAGNKTIITKIKVLN